MDHGPWLDHRLFIAKRFVLKLKVEQSSLVLMDRLMLASVMRRFWQPWPDQAAGVGVCRRIRGILVPRLLSKDAWDGQAFLRSVRLLTFRMRRVRCKQDHVTVRRFAGPDRTELAFATRFRAR